MKNIFKKFIALVLIFIFGHFFINNVWANEEPEVLPSPTPIHLTIISGENSLYDSDISVNACDSDNNPETPDTLTAYCAIIQSGLESDWNWSWAPGAFVNSIEDIVGYTSQDTLGNDIYHYWSWSLNGEMGSTGLNQYELVTSDTILLEFIDPEEEEVEEENNEVDNFLNIDATVDVSKTCELLDIDGNSHLYGDSEDSYLGICALDALIKGNYIENVGLSNQYPSMGLFVTSFNDKEADSNSEYWAIYQQSSSDVSAVLALSGISTLEINQGDIIFFRLSDFMGIETGDFVIIRINSLIQEEAVDEEENNENNGGGGGNSGGSINEKVFSVENAISFLFSQYEEDQSLGGEMYLDWFAIAIANSDNSSLKSNLINYLKNEPINSSVITDYQRRAMALMALGLNPYSEAEIDYIKKIVDSFDGLQLGEIDLVNDDIFGLIVLQNAGYDEDDEIIDKVIAYIISRQNNNGSWGSIDMTSASIMALNNFKNINEVKNVISKAENYLLENQNEDGGFDNIFSTSWAIQALSSNNLYKDEVKDGLKYLADYQNIDGGIEYQGGITNRIWATAYAIPAVLKMSWKDILFSFDKEEAEDNSFNEESEEIIIDDELKEEVVIEEETKVDEIIKKKVEEREIINNYELIIKNEKKEEDKDVITNYKLQITNEKDLLASAGEVISDHDYIKRILIKIKYLFLSFWSFLIGLLS